MFVERCSRCQQQSASHHCADCIANFCEDCSIDLHLKSKFTAHLCTPIENSVEVCLSRLSLQKGLLVAQKNEAHVELASVKRQIQLAYEDALDVIHEHFTKLLTQASQAQNVIQQTLTDRLAQLDRKPDSEKQFPSWKFTPLNLQALSKLLKTASLCRQSLKDDKASQNNSYLRSQSILKPWGTNIKINENACLNKTKGVVNSNNSCSQKKGVIEAKHNFDNQRQDVSELHKLIKAKDEYKQIKRRTNRKNNAPLERSFFLSSKTQSNVSISRKLLLEQNYTEGAINEQETPKKTLRNLLNIAGEEENCYFSRSQAKQSPICSGVLIN